MPTLPEEEEDSPEELDSSSSSPITCTPVENKVVTMPLPTPSIVFPRQDNPGSQDPSPLELARPLSPRPRLSRNSPSSGGPITTVDSTGHVIDLVKDQLPDLQLSAEDKRKNLELLEEAKKVSDRFLTRRGRRSTCSLSESPTGPSPNLTPHSSPVPSRSSSLTVPPQTAPEEPGVNYVNPPANQLLEVRAVGEQEGTGPLDQESLRKLVDWKPKEKRKVSSGTLSPRHAAPGTTGQGSVEQKESGDPRLGGERGRKGPGAGEEEGPGRGVPRRGPDDEAPATGVAKPVPRSNSQQVPCTAEIKTIGAFPPLMRAVSWDTVSSFPARNGAQDLSPKHEEALTFFDKSSDSLFKSSGYKDFPVQPVKMQKLAKMREEHKLIRNQSIVGSKLPDLSETAEQERGPSPCPPLASATEEEAKEKSDVMPNISDVMLRKLKLHRALPGSAPPLTEKEVENTFVQLSLAFRNDSYTLETRLRQAERERNLTEENTEKELEEFKGCLKGSASLWQTSEQRESYQRLLETVAILHRLATRLSSRAEMVGAVRQEKRMNKATEVMMQYVENLKRTYEKDHAELMEFKKLANQNSNRCYGGSIDTGDDGVPRTSRSLSLTLGKALPRRRVSVAVVPKFNLLNIPGQTPQTATGPPLPVLCEANNSKCGPPTEPTQQAVTDGAKAPADQEVEASAPAKMPSNPGEISSEMKAKIEEDAYKKGYQEGLKRCKELQELKEEEEKAEESQEETEEKECKEAKEKKCSSKYEKVLDVLDRLCPKIFRQNRLFWIVLTLFAVTFFVVSVFAYFNDRHSELGDVSAGKTMGPGKKKFFGWNVRFQPKNPTTE
ncbi:inositol 1,4,5-triphosphate receptor associated 1 [Megalops cyprinoides]|uniref:inositol 1,4,5-triphosphate receptor associated 1 n=1 Tax=Megalops cyprinoides TaxID=118141 RepID=UPI0018649B94|nr:inositol 1,4,5-triphosphate receptor associated 1 [Megalops cyprinoides]